MSGAYEWPDALRATVDVIGRALNGAAAWDALTAWDGSGALPPVDVPVGDKRPADVPADGRFVRVLYVDGSDAVHRGFVETHLLEVEGYAADPYEARALVIAARRAMHDAEGTVIPTDVGPRTVRALREPGKPTPLPTGRDGEERWRMALEIDLSARG